MAVVGVRLHGCNGIAVLKKLSGGQLSQAFNGCLANAPCMISEHRHNMANLPCKLLGRKVSEALQS